MYLSNAKFINTNLPEISNRVDLKECVISLLKNYLNL